MDDLIRPFMIYIMVKENLSVLVCNEKKFGVVILFVEQILGDAFINLHHDLGDELWGLNELCWE